MNRSCMISSQVSSLVQTVIALLAIVAHVAPAIITRMALTYLFLSLIRIMDHKEEQDNEVEVLQSIYFDHFIDRTPASGSPYSFQLQIFPYSSETDDEVNYVGLCMEVTLPETYPEVLPQFTLYNIKGLVSAQLNELKSQLLEVAEGYLGTVMVFALASEAQQWLLEHNDQRAEQQQAMKTTEELEYMKQKEDDIVPALCRSLHNGHGRRADSRRGNTCHHR